MAVSGWLGSAWLDFGWASARLKPRLGYDRLDLFWALGSGSSGWERRVLTPTALGCRRRGKTAAGGSAVDVLLAPVVLGDGG